MKTKTKFRLSTLIAVESIIIMVAFILNVYKLKIEPVLASYSEICQLESVYCGNEPKPYYSPETRLKPPKDEEKLTSIQEIISVVASQEGVSNSMLQYIAECESEFQLTRHNYDDPYGGAHGLYQIIFHWHPTVTVECSEDAWCATRYFVKRYKQGDGGLWTCYKNWLAKK